MVHLAGIADGQLVSASEIAEKHHIPRKFLDNIFTELRNAGFVLSRKGKGGGFCLARPANEIAIGNIIRALDGRSPPSPAPARRITAPATIAMKTNAKCAM